MGNQVTAHGDVGAAAGGDEKVLTQSDGLLETPASYQLAPWSPGPKAPYRYQVVGKDHTLSYVNVGDAIKPALLLLHGHSSSVGEFADLFDHLKTDFNVFAVDMPNCGASSTVPIDLVEAFGVAAGYPAYRRGLLFLRDVVAHFAAEVVSKRSVDGMVHVAGGSLGGNLSLWLGVTDPRLPWLERITLWSPGSAWKKSVLNDLATQTAGTYAGYTTWQQQQFFDATYGSSAHVAGLKPQPWFWYFDCWGETTDADIGGKPGAGGALPGKCTTRGGGACKRCDRTIGNVPHLPDIGQYPKMAARKIDYISRAFTGHFALPFDNDRARWHWKIAYETMANSWQSPSGAPLVTQLHVPATFAAGMRDDDSHGGLYGPTRELYDLARDADLPCRARWLADSGHSLHNERPLTLRSLLLEDAP